MILPEKLIPKPGLVAIGLAGLLILCMQSLAAQEKQYFFTNIDKSRGLSHNQALYFLRDSRGFLWTGTVEGLCRFDGYSFKVFKNDPHDSTSLKSNIISRLFEDHEGKIWIGAGDYFDILDPETETFTHQQSLFNNRIQVPVGSKWYHTYDHDGNILYANSVTGVCKYVISHDSVIRISFPQDPATRIIAGIDVDRSGHIWIVCSNCRLYKLSAATFGIIDSVRLPDRRNNYYHFIVDKDDDIWLFDKNNATGALYYDTRAGELHSLTAQSARGRLSSNDLRSMVEDDNGMIWLGTDHGGINIVNKKDLSVTVVVNDPANKRSLCGNSIIRLYKDDQGFVWVGTFKNGISYYHEDQFIFDLYQVIPANKNVSGHNDINNFAEDKKGNIWIATNGGGLIYFDRSHHTFKQYIHDPSDASGISSDIVIGLTIDRKDRLWAGTYFGGLNLFDGHRFQHFRNDPSDPASISDNRIWDICEDSRGMLWIATLMGGVNVFDPERKKVIEHLNLERDTTLNTGAVFSVIEGTGHTMWFATASGIRSFNYNTRKSNYYYADPANPEGLSNGLVYDVYEDSGGFLWAATANGLNRLDPLTGKFRVFRQEDGLPTNLILKIREDDRHNLWMNTSNGLSNMIITGEPEGDTFTCTFRNYNESDGLQGIEFNEKALLKTRSGELFFGGPNGFNILNPANLNFQPVKAPVVFTNFQIFNKSIDHKKPFRNRQVLKKSITFTDMIRLKHDENVFTIEFSGLNFLHPERIHYMYRLDNFNDEWFLSESPERKVTYTNLDPGKYLFRVKASQQDGNRNEEEAQLAVIIMPPWWGTIFVKIISLILLTSAIVGFYYFRLFSLNRQKRRLEHKVKERTNELSDTNVKLKERQGELSDAYMQLQERQKEILMQNMELEKHRNHLEQLVQERTNELEEALRKAMESDRLKSAFLANMSHEIRTPMNAIIGFSGLLDDPEIAYKDRKEYIQLIHTNSESLLMLINDILDISMIEANQMTIHKEPFGLNELLNQVFSLYKLSNVNSNLEIRLNNPLAGEHLKLKTDKFRLKQVLSNLMNNACKFTKDGSIELGAAKDNGRLSIYVKDTGVGISDRDIRHLFERFRKLGKETSRQTRGTGLGLAISKKLAELLGGTIEVVSEFGQGSVFTFTIPWSLVATEDGIDSKPAKRSNFSKDWSGKKILIVEDEEANYFYLQRILEKTRASVIWAENGQEAVNQVESGAQFDLILMDIKMPEMDGIETMKRLKARNPGQLIIAQTAYARTEDEIMFRQHGFDDYLAKPISFNDLLHILEKYF